MADISPVVIDNGTGMVKAGIAGDEAPRCVFPSVIGRPNVSSIQPGEGKSMYIGEEAIQHRGICNLTFPIAHGRIDSWDDMEALWNHTFYNELRVSPEEAPVMLTEAPKNPRKNREKMVEIMFETFNVPAMYISIQAVLSLYASGRTTGIVLDSGDGVSHTVPIFEGYSINDAVERIDLAGRDLTGHMQRLLNEHHSLSLMSSSEKDVVREIKEKVCYVAIDYDAELAKGDAINTTYTLPSNEVVTIGRPRFDCPEALFRPELMEGNRDNIQGIHRVLHNSINKCDLNLRKELYRAVVLSGGSTMYDGLADRLEKELKSLAHANTEVQVIAPPERKYSVWIGGSVLASLQSFEKQWMTKAEFEDSGASLVHTKCT